MEQVQQNKEAENQTIAKQNKSTKTSKSFSSKTGKNAIQAKQSGIPPKPTKQGQLPAKTTKQGAQPVLQAKFGKVLQRKPLEEDPPKKHKAKRGETVYSICKKYGISQDDFKRWNGLSDNSIAEGKSYYVSDPAKDTDDPKTTGTPINYTAQSGDNMTQICKKYGISKADFKRWNGLEKETVYADKTYIVGYSTTTNTTTTKTTPTTPTGTPIKYTAKSGDNLTKICKKHSISKADFKRWNGLEKETVYADKTYIVGYSTTTNTTTTKTTSTTPTGTPVNYTAQSGDNLIQICKKHGISKADFKRWNELTEDAIYKGKTYIVGYSTTPKKTTPTGTPIKHTAIGGETVYSICKKYGISQADFKRWNELTEETVYKDTTYIVGYSDKQITKEEKPNSGEVIEEKNTETPKKETTKKDEKPKKKNESTASAEGNKALKKDFTFTESAAANSDFTSWAKGTIVGNTTDPTKVNIKHLASLQDRLMQIDKTLLGADWGNAKLKALKDKAAKDLTKEEKELIKKHIARTIKAITRFQERYSVSSFNNKTRNDTKKGETAKYILTETTSRAGFTEKQVKQGDATYIILRDFRRYTWQYTGADGKQKNMKAQNFVYNWANTYEEGVQINGKDQAANFPLNKFKEAGSLSDKQAKALKFASKHEGGFDALNTYDQAVISFGYVQFAGNEKGTFTLLMAYIKHYEPSTFQARFQQYGIDVAYVLKNQQIESNPHPKLVLKTDKKNLKGTEAEKYIQQHPHYLGVFMRAAEDTKVKEQQIHLSVDHYAKPTGGSRLADKSYLKNVTDLTKAFDIEILRVDNGKDKKPTIKVGDTDIAAYKKTEAYKTAKKAGKVSESDFGDKLGGLKLQEILRSERGLAGLYSLMVNTPEYTKLWFKLAILDIIKAEGLTTLAQVKAIPAKKILKKVKVRIDASKNTASQKKMRKGRIQHALDSKNLSDKK
ncbi:MAG TPA: hypothetical protein DCS93_36055 [Microscillaceae bacterium]|nr:hypothetical protein [Microscillaceae bacterium]